MKDVNKEKYIFVDALSFTFGNKIKCKYTNTWSDGSSKHVGTHTHGAHDPLQYFFFRWYFFAVIAYMCNNTNCIDLESVRQSTPDRLERCTHHICENLIYSFFSTLSTFSYNHKAIWKFPIRIWHHTKAIIFTSWYCVGCYHCCHCCHCCFFDNNVPTFSTICGVIFIYYYTDDSGFLWISSVWSKVAATRKKK